MRFRKLRIAWSVAWGLLAVLLVVLWVRSYWRIDILFRTDGGGRMTTLRSLNGVAIYQSYPLPLWPSNGPAQAHGWKYICGLVPEKETEAFKWKRIPGGRVIHLPMPLLLLTAAGIALAPWLRARFSIRTLLIATTLVAVVLGLAVWTAS
jgi:hypothetical protein